ncbi:MAG: RluA family pseudouridine synthase [Hyphomicrobiales bacterium]|nr:RluA family pseudouridine synthase [Hyphomicrobiales bacterium]
MEPNTYTVMVAADKAGVRLDRLLAESVPDLSRVRLKMLIEGGHVDLLGRGLALEVDRRVHTGECYVVVVPAVPPFIQAELRPQAMNLNIIHEDGDLIVIDKPAGLVVHPGAGNPDGTLVNGLLAHCTQGLSTIGAPYRPGIVHRIDKDTSGVMVVAKTDRAHLALADQFARHSVDRAYLALVWGCPDPKQGRISGAIGRSPANPTKMAVVSKGGKTAVTHYRVMQTYAEYASLVECRLETGRTHQIRVHMASIGHPLMADGVYGSGSRQVKDSPQSLVKAVFRLGRQALHAYVIGFDHPNGEMRSQFRTLMPHDINRLTSVLEAL